MTTKPSRPTEGLRCISCGTDQIKPRRRYCSLECRRQINWVLSLSKGLLRTFNARYAAFSFTDDDVILDVLPVWSNEISRFVCKRMSGNKPAGDFKKLILRFGSEWHGLVDSNKSMSYASLFLLNKNNNKDINPESIKPDRKSHLRLSKHEKVCMKVLKLNRQDLSGDSYQGKIRSAYKRLAKIYHPDMGGDESEFRQLNQAYNQMLLWAESPSYSSRKALRNCWFYDGSTNRWAPPL